MFNQKIGYILKALVISFFTTAILIVLFAFLMYKFRISENVVELGVIIIYILSCGLGGFYIGKVIKERKFLWGLLVGALYLVVLLIVSVIVGGENSLLSGDISSLIMLCLGGGTLGGMLA